MSPFARKKKYRECSIRVVTSLKHTSVPTKPIFFSDLLEEGQILFGNIVNFALENPTNLWKYDIMCTLILDWYETEI